MSEHGEGGNERDEEDRTVEEGTGEGRDGEEHSPSVIPPSAADVQVPADLLREAVGRLKQLNELRQEETERQRMLVTRMQESIQSHARVNRWVLKLVAVLVVVVGLLAFAVVHLTGAQRKVAGDVEDVSKGLRAARSAVRQGVAIQSRKLLDMRRDLAEARAQQEEMSRELAGDVGRRIDASVVQLREERDIVKSEVGRVLEEKTDLLAEREVFLDRKAQRIESDMERAREQRKEIIAEAIEKLTIVGDQFDVEPAGLTVTPEAPTPEDAGAAEPPVANGPDLSGHVLVTGPLALAGAASDVSGVALRPQTGTYLLVVNNPPQIVEITPEGDTVRTIELAGFEDTEGITWISGSTFAVVEERRRRICVFSIPDDATVVEYEGVEKILVDPEEAGNQGIEGLCYDPVGRRFLAVKEKDPRRIYEIPYPWEGEGPPPVAQPWDIEENGLDCSDLSGIAYHEATGSLLILSHESGCVVACTPEGGELARLSLSAGSAGLDADVLQAEGIAVDAEGRLIVCGEPNLFYIFAPKEAGKPGAPTGGEPEGAGKTGAGCLTRLPGNMDPV